jgi:hypothetical protein
MQSGVIRNLVVAAIGFSIWLIEIFAFVRLGQPELLANIYWIIFSPSLFLGFAWANWGSFPTLPTIGRILLCLLGAIILTCAWFFALIYPALWFQLKIGGSL